MYGINEEVTITVLKAGPSFKILATNRLDTHTLANLLEVDNLLFMERANICIAF